jgi:hypothetical protein
MNSAQPLRSDKCRSQDFGPHLALHHPELVQHYAVEIDSAQGVWVVSTVQPDLGPVGIVDRLARSR